MRRLALLLLLAVPAFAQVASIRVDPIKLGELTPFHVTARAFNSDGREIATPFTYAVTDPAIARIDPASGDGNTWSLGKTTLTVSAGGIKAVAPVEVIVPLVALEITPDNTTLYYGHSAQYHLFGVWGDGNRMEISGAITSRSPMIASIDSSRMVQAHSCGSTAFDALIVGPAKKWAGSTMVNIISETAPTMTTVVGATQATSSASPTSAVPVQKVILQPDALTVAVGMKGGFTLTAVYADGTKQILPNASWMSSNKNVAGVDVTGQAVGYARGMTTVTATAVVNGVTMSGQSALTVQ
jgi:hypothetical protein